MARLTSFGFELNSATDAIEMEDVNSAAVDAAIIRSGAVSFRINGLTSTIRKGFLQRLYSSATTVHVFIRTYFRYTTLPTAANAIMGLAVGNSFGGDTVLAWITISNTGVLQLNDEDGSIGSASAALNAGTWYMIEYEVDTSPSAGSHVVKARLDGAEFAAATNRNISRADLLYYRFGGNFRGEAQTTADWYFDDIAINDSSGSFQNSWPGEGKIIHLLPNADGDTVNFTDNVAGAQYTAVDEVTPDDATTMVYSQTSGNISEANLDSSRPRIGVTDTINVVQVGWRFSANAVAGTQPIQCLRIKAAASGTVEESANITHSTTTWHTNAVAAPKNYPLTLYDLPGASTTVWAQSDLETAQIGVRQTNTSNPLGQVTVLWLLVDYTEKAFIDRKPRPRTISLTKRNPLSHKLMVDVPFHDRGASTLKNIGSKRLGFVFQATPTWTTTPSVLGQGVTFNGTTQDAETTAVCSTVVDNWSMEVWFVANGFTAESQIFYNGTTFDGYGIELANSQVGILYAGVAQFLTGVHIAPGRLTHIVAVRKNGTTRVYVNGLDTGATSTSTPNTPTAGTTIAARTDNQQWFNGTVYCARIWERPLAEKEIQALFADPWVLYRSQTFIQMGKSIAAAAGAAFAGWRMMMGIGR